MSCVSNQDTDDSDSQAMLTMTYLKQETEAAVKQQAS